MHTSLSMIPHAPTLVMPSLPVSLPSHHTLQQQTHPALVPVPSDILAKVKELGLPKQKSQQQIALDGLIAKHLPSAYNRGVGTCACKSHCIAEHALPMALRLFF